MAIDTLYPQELLKKAALDSSRPKYHFSPPAAWMNDPNGLVFFKGKYHLFHQCNPLSPNPGRMGWGHAISNDGGVHWSYEPLALIPDNGFNEETASLPDGGCFTGCPVVKDDKLYLIYTNSSTGENGEVSQIQRIAVSEDGYTFKKIPTPIIDCFPPEGSEQFRDPKVWRHGEQWYCVIGSCKDGLGNVLLYRSIDLYHWEYVGEMLRANSVEEHGWMWECPSFFTIDDTDFLLISPMGLEEKGIICGYFIGKLDYDTGKFKADSFHNLCHSPEFYSAQVYTPEGYDTPVLIGWMQHWIVPEYPTKKCGWNGVHSLHYACGYDKDSGRLTLNPVPRIHSLRQNALHLSEGADPLLGVNCDAFELDISVDFHEAKENAKFDLYLRCNNDGNEYTCVSYDYSSGKVKVDCSHSGQHGGNLISEGYVGSEFGVFSMQVFVDCCSIEVIVNGGEHIFSHRIFPSEDSQKMSLLYSDGAQIKTLSIYPMKSIYL